MKTAEFRTILCSIQQKPYHPPNQYFAWERPDGTLFMVGTQTGQYGHVLKYQYEECFKSYSAHFYDLSGAGDPESKTHKPEPIDRLVKEVSEYRYIGAWEDPDILMDSSYGNGRVLAHGRWELAKANIPGCEKFLTQPNKKASLDEQIKSAAEDLLAQQAEHLPRGMDAPEMELS